MSFIKYKSYSITLEPPSTKGLPLLTRWFSPTVAEQDRRATQSILSQARSVWRSIDDDRRQTIAFEILQTFLSDYPALEYNVHPFYELIRALMDEEPTLFAAIDEPRGLSLADEVDYRNYLRRIIEHHRDIEQSIKLWQASVYVAIEPLIGRAELREEQTGIKLGSAPLIRPDAVGEVVYSLLNATERGYLVPLAHKITENIDRLYPGDKRIPEVDPKVFMGTPFARILTEQVEHVLPQKLRFEHMHVLAGTGHGKTQALQNLIYEDIQRGDCSVILIDSQGDAIRKLSHLEAVRDRLVLLDAKDIEYPLGLNLFAPNMSRIQGYSALLKEQTINGIIELYDFIYSALDADLTSKQSVLWRFLTRLLLAIPNATIHTFRELLEDNGYAKYRQHADKLSPTARIFFETEFDGREFATTKKQILRRVWALLENESFNRMFSAAENKVDMYALMQQRKVILINTAQDLLKADGCSMLGRFFLALIGQAAFERAALPEDERVPCFVYIDEAAQYINGATNISTMLEQCRKYRVGITLAHQYIGQLDPKLQQSFASNTSIKFVGGVSDRDARAMAQEMRCQPDYITSQPMGHFAAYAKGLGVFSHAVPLGAVEKAPRMAQGAWEAVLATQRATYASKAQEPPNIPLPDAPKDPTKRVPW